MKRIETLLLAAFLLFVGVMSAEAQVNWAVKAGLNVSNVTDLKADYRAGFNGGIMGQFMIDNAFGLETGLFYSMQGYKLDTKLTDETFTASYLKLPVQAIYKFNVGQNLYLYPAAGLYFAYGVGGSEVSEHKVAPHRKRDYFDVAKRFDMGMALGANLQFEKFLIGLGYDYGFMKVFKGSTHNSNVMVNVGYFF